MPATTLPHPTAHDLLARVRAGFGEAPGGERLPRETDLALAGSSLVTELIGVGQAYADALADPDARRAPAEARVRAGAFVYDWPEGAKRLAVLWRNVLLEWERALVLRREGRATEASLRVLAQAAQTRLEAAVRHWAGDFDERLARLLASPGAADAQLYTWSLQRSPWPVYRAQLEAVQAQMAALHDDFGVRIAAAGTLADLVAALRRAPRQLERSLDELRAAAEEALALVEPDGAGAAAAADPAAIDVDALERLDRAEALPRYAESLAETSNAIIDRLPERARLFVTDAAGRMRYRDVNLERQTGQWLSAEVLPDLQRGGRSVEQAAADLGRTLMDVRNRVLLAREVAEGGGAAEAEPLAEPLRAYLQRLGRARADVAAAGAASTRKVDDELRLSRVYDPELSFLEVSFEAGISEVRRRQDALLTRAGRWVLDQRGALRRLRARVATEESLSTGERVVRVLRSRTIAPEVSAYASVLVTRGFIGEAFHAGREVELERAATAIEAWREGYRGAIALTGQRYSGKTHFAELLAGRYFEQGSVRLRAFSTLEVAGRTTATTCDLRAAIAFVRKHSVGERPLVLIDDLELWSDTRGRGLAENAAALRDAMDELSGRMMFVVTMGNWTFARLSDGVDLAAAFQVEINLDTLQMGPFAETALARHAATHLTLVGGDKEQELTEAALRDHAEVVWRAARGNVGDGLRRWAQSIARVDASRVRVEAAPGYQLPNFVDADTGVVLAAVKRERYVNEYDLRQRFGPAFDERYRSVVRRLVRLEVLLRHRTGTLSINPVVSNEIGRLLARESFIAADYAQTPIQL